jgi:RND family efflux transporter MFP subunit
MEIMWAGILGKLRGMAGWLVKRWWVVLAILVIAVGGWWFLVRKSERITDTARVEEQVIREIITASGTVKAEKEATLKFLAPTKVTWVGVKEGDKVKAWQGMAAVDQRQLEKNLQVKLSQYMDTRWDFEQAQDDYLVGGRRYEQVENLTEAERRILEKSQFGLDQAVLNVEIANLAAREAVLVSPIAGTVTEVANLKTWVNLTAGDVNSSYVRVVDLSSLYFEAEVDETDYGKVAVGQQAEVDLDAFGDQTLQGKVSKVGKQGVKSTSGVVNVLAEIRLDDQPGNLVTGLNGEARVVVAESQPVLAVAKKFVEFLPDKTVVKVQSKGKIMEREIITGLITDNWVEIKEGLSEGETVVVTE